MLTIHNSLRCHDLVALIHVAIGSDAHHTYHQNNILLASQTSGILETNEGNERTFPILDTLATISMSHPTSHVVAIGFQCKHES